MTPITVVVPTRDRPERLRTCLAALADSVRPADEVIVVDSASRVPIVRPEPQRVPDHRVPDHRAPDHRVVRVDQAGASRARNAGWRAATHGIVAFIDDDVVVDPGWAEGVATAFADHPEAAWVAGRIGLAPGVDHDRPVAFLDRADDARLSLETRSGDLGHSANLSVRVSALLAVGGFDERLGAGARYHAAEDLDLIDRILLAGMTGWYSPAARATHDQWRSRWALVGLDWTYGIGAGVRITKLARSAPRRARREASVALWEYGLAQVPHHAVRGHKFLTLTPLARVAGTIVGMGRGSLARVRDGHLV